MLTNSQREHELWRLGCNFSRLSPQLQKWYGIIMYRENDPIPRNNIGGKVSKGISTMLWHQAFLLKKSTYMILVVTIQIKRSCDCSQSIFPQPHFKMYIAKREKKVSEKGCKVLIVCMKTLFLLPHALATGASNVFIVFLRYHL